ncbi:formimidoylglutamate deiminase [Defluviimonas sp. WL0024]|uniref:Formimidoylglutamate deiminase n=1 Tax=Albidovulum salinarum TaxID=2984153 RepID=A0ABT2X0I0_9RHOB|nr:formimidoylglutamate deiminase [Defluviimonas sp. WL0024]MCU9847190.1 formimidoylglutamate deiminase [Defluviimonas sp. WL0024]
MIFAKRALLAQGWARDVRVTVGEGRIAGVAAGRQAEPGDAVVDTLLPALSNLHSHTFQRAMAGMTEYRAEGRESFWTWRELMYRFLDRLTPEDVEAIAAMTFVEMQEAGYAAVGEFHYVHHQPGGARYADPAELSARILAAAEATGIGLTHLPVLYTYGGAGRQALGGGQLRFGNDLDGYAGLLAAVRRVAGGASADTSVGVAPHSLRATCPEDLVEVPALAGGAPIHIHIAEQPKEVADISGWLGARPVEWLMANAPVGANWCAVHATHMTAVETEALARSGAVAGLCPITEANLGDGPFNGPGWIAAGGLFGLGSDSNVRISLTEELRTLEYSQRLRDLERNVMVPGAGSVGGFLYTEAARGGAQALGRSAGAIEAGLWADLVAIDAGHPALCGLGDEQLLDGLCFAASDAVVTDLWSAGRHRVREGRHVARASVTDAYRKTVAGLVARL